MARYHFQSGSFPEIKASIHMSGPVLDVPKWVEDALSNDQIKQVFVLYQGPAGEKVDVWSRITEKGDHDEPER